MPDDDVVVYDDDLVATQPVSMAADEAEEGEEDECDTEEEGEIDGDDCDDCETEEDDDADDEEASTTEEEEEEEEEEADESSEEEQPPRKQQRGGAASNDPMRRLAAIAKAITKKRNAIVKKTINEAVLMVAALIEKHQGVINSSLDAGDFVSDDEGVHITVCKLTPDLLKIVGALSATRSEWLNTLSEMVYDSCSMEVCFTEDNMLVIVLPPDEY